MKQWVILRDYLAFPCPPLLVRVPEAFQFKVESLLILIGRNLFVAK